MTVRRLWICGLLLGGLLLLAPSARAEYGISEHSLPLSASGEKAEYLLYTPAQAPTKERAPLLVALYGMGGSLKKYDLKRQVNSTGLPMLMPFLPWATRGAD